MSAPTCFDTSASSSGSFKKLYFPEDDTEMSKHVELNIIWKYDRLPLS